MCHRPNGKMLATGPQQEHSSILRSPWLEDRQKLTPAQAMRTPEAAGVCDAGPVADQGHMTDASNFWFYQKTIYVDYLIYVKASPFTILQTFNSMPQSNGCCSPAAVTTQVLTG